MSSKAKKPAKKAATKKPAKVKQITKTKKSTVAHDSPKTDAERAVPVITVAKSGDRIVCKDKTVAELVRSFGEGGVFVDGVPVSELKDKEEDDAIEAHAKAVAAARKKNAEEERSMVDPKRQDPGQ